jgi:uncharacterized membrane protein YedE/YeeE
MKWLQPHLHLAIGVLLVAVLTVLAFGCPMPPDY